VVYLRHVIINTLHKGDKEDNNNNSNNNNNNNSNNNNIFAVLGSKISFRQILPKR
jgi:hypothetical protein